MYIFRSMIEGPVFFFIYSLLFTPVLVPAMKYEIILNYFSIPVTYGIEKIADGVMGVSFLCIAGLVYCSTTLRTNFDYEFVESITSVPGYILDLFRREPQ